MKRLKNWRIWQLTNGWIFLILLVGNGVAWSQTSEPVDYPEAAPILHPEIGEIRARWQARDAVGDSFSIVVTDQMAMETIAWFIEPYDELPVSHPYVEIHADGIIGGGVLNLLGLRTPVLGNLTVWVEDGKVTGEVNSITVAGKAAPQFVVEAVRQAQSIYDDLSFPIVITKLELREGEILLEGEYR